ncbi:MAG: MFS transporter [Acidimicrobiales bacterium]|nr:MFS transporter [Acidimicrobiales bacterium]MCB1013995.1 MFS transporter [Acidimicrobiales bacterium]
MAAELDPRRWWALAVLCLSLLLIVMDNTIVNVALPTIQRDLDATGSELQWIVDAYVLVFAGLLLTMGSLGDRFGRKPALSLGLVVMGGASAISAWSSDPSHLIFWRAVMGIGGALIMPATLSILTNVFTDHRERARAIAIWAGTSGMAVAIGPVTGGWLLDHFWWGSVFLVNVPVVVVALVAGHRIIPDSKDPHPPALDPFGAALSIVGLVTLVWAIIEAPQKGWTDRTTLGAFAVATVLLVGFVVHERRSDHPMLDVGFFRNPRFSAASGAITMTFFAMFGTLFLFTQYMQFVLGYSPLATGARFIPMALVTMVVAPSSARIVERVGTKAVVATGLTMTSVALALGTFLTAGGGYLPLLGVLVVMAVGMGLTMAPATESIMGSLPLTKAGVGSAVNDTTRQVGGALGVAVMGSLLASAYGAKMADFLAGLPTAVPDAAASAIEDSVGAAVNVAAGLPGPAADALTGAARTAYVEAMGTSLWLAAGVALLGAIVALVALPARATVPEDSAG